jgi:hypothetical protein
MSEEWMMEAERIEYIKSAYGIASVRKFMLFDRSGVPERYWTTAWTGKLFQPHQFRFITVLGDADDVNTFVCAHVRRMIDQGKRCQFYDFLMMLSDNIQYGSIRDGWISEMAGKNLVAITGVSYGELYDKHANIFPMILNSIANSGGIKTIIVGMENVADTDFEEAYGTHYVRQIVRSRESVTVRIVTGSIKSTTIK